MTTAYIKASVLIVDDNSDTREAIRLTLEQESHATYAFKFARTVSEGLKKVASFRPEVIILDLHLPGKDGFDFLDALGKLNYPRSHVVMLTADNTLKNLWEAESKGVGAYNFMGKPFEGDELRALILSLVLATAD